MSLIAVRQINQTDFQLAVQQYASGAAFSGNLVAYAQAGGWFGNNVVAITGDQVITGAKTFQVSPVVPYVGGTGTAPSRLYTDNQNVSTSGILSSTISTLSGFTTGISGALQSNISSVSGALSALRVTGSTTIPIANFTGQGGTTIVSSGGFIFISGAAGGGGGSNTSVTGSAAINAPNFTGVGLVTLSYDGTYVRVSGATPVDTVLSGYLENNFVRLTGDQTLSGVKTFILSPIVPNATIGTQAVNLNQLSGASGVLVGAGTINNYYITGTGVVTASFNASGNITNTFSITSGNTINVANSGTSTNTFNNSGAINVTNVANSTNTFNGSNSINLSGITGNFVNISFYYDQYNLSTGLNTIEGFVSRDFYFTGYGVGAVTSGTQGIFSGSLYQRNPLNVKTSFLNFSLNSGLYFYASGGFSNVISGMNRVGVDILAIGTGITGLSVGIFGVGY